MTTAANRAIRNDRIINIELASRKGVCACGCKTELIAGTYHWHHMPNTVKRAAISNLRRATVAVLAAELGKCVPMTASCHLKCHGH